MDHSPDESPEGQDTDDRPDEDRPSDEGPAEGPRPEPGLTAPLDDVTEEEAKSGPMGVMPGAGPDPDEARHSGVEEQEEREEEKES
jgi:hypothetical protein